MMDNELAPFRGVDEVQQLIEGLSMADHLRLRGWARHLVAGTKFKPDDLLHEALVGVLSGERRCKSNLSIMVFLWSTMRSMASDNRNSVWTARTEAFTDEEETSVRPQRAGVDPQFESLAKDALDKLYKACNGDEKLEMVMMYKGEGYSPNEVQEQLNLTPVEYASSLRQIRRLVDRLYPEGWDS